MKQKSEIKKHNKGKPADNKNVIIINRLTDKIIKKGFVALPGNTSSSKNNDDRDILVGRTKNGGFVSYPKKQAIIKKGFVSYYLQEACL